MIFRGDFSMNVKILILLYVLIIFLVILSFIVRTINIKRKIRGLADNVLEITPAEFFKIRNTCSGCRGRQYISTNYDFTGVYIIHNHTKDMYYVGQGKKVLKRVNNHFTGRGNGDVYADYKYGDDFTIKMIALEKSGCKTLNELERNTIMTYNAYYGGYNKTKGNQG